jgi:hypothetical protein
MTVFGEFFSFHVHLIRLANSRERGVVIHSGEIGPYLEIVYFISERLVIWPIGFIYSRSIALVFVASYSFYYFLNWIEKNSLLRCGLQHLVHGSLRVESNTRLFRMVCKYMSLVQRIPRSLYLNTKSNIISTVIKVRHKGKKLKTTWTRTNI